MGPLGHEAQDFGLGWQVNTTATWPLFPLDLSPALREKKRRKIPDLESSTFKENVVGERENFCLKNAKQSAKICLGERSLANK